MGVLRSKALAAVKLSFEAFQKLPPNFLYVMCIGVLNTSNLYLKPCVLQSV